MSKEVLDSERKRLGQVAKNGRLHNPGENDVGVSYLGVYGAVVSE